MKTFSITEFRRDPARVLRVAATGAAVALTRRGKVVFESAPEALPKTLSAYDIIGIASTGKHYTDKQLKRGFEKGITEKWRKPR